jgi:uncharacterized DUF497 family protein
MEFEWDPEKEKANLAKHGVSFVEAIPFSVIPSSLLLPTLIIRRRNFGSSALVCPLEDACLS